MSLAEVRGLPFKDVEAAAAAGVLRDIILGAASEEVVDLGQTRSALALASARLALLRRRDLG